MTKLARRQIPAKSLLLAPLLISLLAGACVLGGGDDDAAPPTKQSLPEAPAISRSGPEATETPFGGPTPRPTRVPATAVPPTPEPVQSPLDGFVSVVYSYPFIWPVDGPITSFMSPEHPNGIDIGLENNDSREIRAAAGGTVTHAGGDDDEALGISIVIDHGNGVTTTYGHLSEVRVEEGDEVEIGQVIGIGGNTGISTGPHLHFEVRKDGDTVDPLHVLPTGDGDTTTFQIDCATTPFTLPAGSHALIDFEGILEDGEEIVTVDALPKNDGPALEYTVQDGTEVSLSSAIDFNGPDGLDSYDLEVTIDNSAENHLFDCPFTVQQKEVPTTFYVRANPPASDVETPADGEPVAASDTQVAQPTPTATPNPWAAPPSYAVPTASAGGQTPSYGVPSGSAGAAPPPSYGIPGTGATPTPGQ